MTNILCIETSEKTCSVALSQNGEKLDEIINTEDQSHAKKLTVLIDEILKKNNFTFSDLKAVAVSCGPGSYTGLRIGVTTAKGICFGRDLPLIALNTLDVIFTSAKEKYKDYAIYVPNIDARRNEVFMSIKSTDGENLLETQPVILDENPLNQIAEKNCLIAGSGSLKFKPHVRELDKIDDSIKPLAGYMCRLAFNKFKTDSFEDVAYFEPTYFKAVHTTVSKKKLFGV